MEELRSRRRSSELDQGLRRSFLEVVLPSKLPPAQPSPVWLSSDPAYDHGAAAVPLQPLLHHQRLLLGRLQQATALNPAAPSLQQDSSACSHLSSANIGRNWRLRSEDRVGDRDDTRVLAAQTVTAPRSSQSPSQHRRYRTAPAVGEQHPTPASAAPSYSRLSSMAAVPTSASGTGTPLPPRIPSSHFRQPHQWHPAAPSSTQLQQPCSSSAPANDTLGPPPAMPSPHTCGTTLASCGSLASTHRSNFS